MKHLRGVEPDVPGAFVRSILALVLAASSAAGCVQPVQSGGVVVLPGATERVRTMMRYGLINVRDFQAPASVIRIAREELLIEGRAATARVGDWMLENGPIVAVVGQIDGTSRGGRLVDLARKPGGADGLEDHELFVFGKLVVYETLRRGYDDATGAAYVETSAVVDRSIDGLPVVSVATRYDVAPGIDAILAHTQIKVISGEVPEGAPPLVAERIYAQGAVDPVVRPATAASIGQSQGYVVHAISSPAELGADGKMTRLTVPASFTPGRGGTVLVSRLIAPLERPDTAALAVAEARIAGERIGELRVRLVDAGRPPSRIGTSDLVLRGEGGTEIVARGAVPCPLDSSYAVQVPEGKYEVLLRGSVHVAEGAKSAVVAGERTETVTIEVAPATEPYASPEGFVWRCAEEIRDEALP